MMPITILDFLRDFAPDLDAPSWQAWRTFLAAVFALDPSEADLGLYHHCTGREAWPTAPAREIVARCGRRAGKSRIVAAIAVWSACFRTYRLAPGEVGVFMVVAADRKQAGVILNYCRALLRHPLLAGLVESEQAEAISLTNGLAIEVHTASYRSVRGRTVIGAICDEVAYWYVEGAQPDAEVLGAIRPATATTGGPIFLISSPHGQAGEMNRLDRLHYGRDGSDVLVWTAPTRTMNPTVPEDFIARAYAEDPERAAAEYGAEYRTDVQGFVDRGAVEACVDPGVRERLRSPGVRYQAFVDVSGGRNDAFVTVIAHGEGDGLAVIDAIRVRQPPFNPDDATREAADLVRAYGVGTVVGDRFGGEWPVERFRAHGLTYQPAGKAKSDLYLGLLPAINARRVILLDDEKAVAQIAGLERRVSRTGRDVVDHRVGGHDDVANGIAGAVDLVLGAGAVVPRISILTEDGWE